MAQELRRLGNGRVLTPEESSSRHGLLVRLVPPADAHRSAENLAPPLTVTKRGVMVIASV